MQHSFMCKRNLKTIAATVVACGAVAVFASAAIVDLPDSARIEGFVRDAQGVAIPQVSVALKPPSGAGKSVVTDAQGSFTFSGLAPGAYSLTMAAPGFQTARYVNITLTAAQTRQFDFMLRPGAVSDPLEFDVTKNFPPEPSDFGGSRIGETGSVSGRILYANGAAASGVTVGAIPADTGFLPRFPLTLFVSTRTDQLGFYRLNNLPAGLYFIAAGFEVFTQWESVIDQPTFFPGVRDMSQAAIITVGNRDKLADFRLGESVTLPPVLSRTLGPFHVSGYVVSSPAILALPVTDRQFIEWKQLRVTLYPTVNTVRGQRGCPDPARAAFVSSVASDGKFNFPRVLSGVYDICVFQSAGRIYSGASGPASIAIHGPVSIVVDHDIDGLLLQLRR